MVSNHAEAAVVAVSPQIFLHIISALTVNRANRQIRIAFPTRRFGWPESGIDPIQERFLFVCPDSIGTSVGVIELSVRQPVSMTARSLLETRWTWIF
jgi:hypothetical protein